MKIFIASILLCLFGTLHAQATEENAPALAESATASPDDDTQSGSSMAVIKINTGKLYVYDADYEELGTIKASEVKRDFTDLDFAGEAINGLPVLGIDEQEGLVSVALSKYDEPVWIETMSVELWPGNRLDCPEITVGKSEIEQSGLTMGFGDNCKQPE